MTEAHVDYTDWIGNQETALDRVSLSAVEGMIAAMDRDDPAPQTGDVLPVLWHWMNFAPKARQSKIGPDGHPERGDFLPPVALPRRMFAGAQYRFHKPLLIGDEITREGRIGDVTTKEGRSGTLVFVKVNYVVSTANGVTFEEDHDIVYRGEAESGDKAPPPAAPAKDGRAQVDWRRMITPDPVLLFRYSALTFNGHRIHYDRKYATEIEGYPGLVVHGPLIATLLLELLRDNQPGRELASFHFRAKRPLFDVAPFEVTGGVENGSDDFWLQALNPQGLVAMEAGGTFAG